MSGVAAIAGRIAEVRALVGERPAPIALASDAPAGSAVTGIGGTDDFAQALARLSAPASSAVVPSSASASASASALSLPPTAAGAGATGGQAIVDQATRYLGVPYVFGGEDMSGMDCSGLVQRVLADLGVSVPRVVPDQARVGTEVASLADARPGDLIVTRDRGHIVIYAGDGKILHAPRPGKNVELISNYLGPGDIGTIRRIDVTGAAS